MPLQRVIECVTAALGARCRIRAVGGVSLLSEVLHADQFGAAECQVSLAQAWPKVRRVVVVAAGG